MRLKDCKSVKDVGDWMKAKGFTPGENAHFGTVHPVHSPSSWHYKIRRAGRVVEAKDRQGKLALDVNDNDVRDDRLPFDSETEALNWLYDKIHETSRVYKWPLEEMFFNTKGFIREKGFGVNHAIGGHASHLHAAWNRGEWK